MPLYSHNVQFYLTHTSCTQSVALILVVGGARTPCSVRRFACGLFVAPLMQAFIETHNVYVLEQLGLVFRNSLMGAIYRKSLKLNAEALNSASTGKIVTLMSNDAQKLQARTARSVDMFFQAQVLHVSMAMRL